MAKVNFTKEHYAKMKELAFAMLVSNHTISTKLGQPLNIVELMHNSYLQKHIKHRFDSYIFRAFWKISSVVRAHNF